MTRGRALLLALAVGLAPVLQLIGFFLHPVIPDDPAGLLAVAARSPERWFLVHAVAASAAALTLVAAVALAGLVRDRGSRPATVGAVLMVLGGSVLTFAFGAEAHLLSLASDRSLDTSAMVELTALESSSLGARALLIGFPLLGLGQVVLMIGLLRSRAVPTWMPWAVLVGLIASLAAAPGALLGPLLLAPAVVGQLGLARQVVRQPQANAVGGAGSRQLAPA